MSVVCRTADELLHALQEAAETKIEKAVIEAQTAMAVFCFETWSAAKATWSKEQPNDYWSGQYRASVNISVGSPDLSYAPDNDGDWPIHQDPYPAKAVSYAMSTLAQELTQPYKVVWISDNVPHALDVEEHTGAAQQVYSQLRSMAAEFTRAHFSSEAIV